MKLSFNILHTAPLVLALTPCAAVAYSLMSNMLRIVDSVSYRLLLLLCTKVAILNRLRIHYTRCKRATKKLQL